MKRLLRFGRFGVVHFFTLVPLLAQPVGTPKLAIRPLGVGQVQVSWPATTTGFVLEATDAVSAFVAWQPVNTIPTTRENEFAVTLTGGAGNRFFRLRQEAGASLTSITATSPVDGETGVAVMRETIVHLSGPLATNAVIKTNNFYAVAAGRRILSRIELSSDRTKATLFYLEPLPGSARVNVFFDAEGLTDALGQPLDPAGTGQANGLKVISFETLSLTPLTGTAMIGRVFASELMPGADTGTNAVNRPLEGVTITVDGREQELRTKTDAMGNFTLAPVPPGRFFVKIDGRTAKGSAYPNGAYYPYVGKAWDAVAGKTNNLAGGTGEIFLPLITPGTLQPVSMTQDTPISFPANVVTANPALAGVTITVPANALFSDDGTRGGKVGIAPVPPDRLPGPLPPGLELPLVITVQTDGGLNFDKPAPICFPNLPDPVLKTPLPANSKQALISFNHDKGIWEAVGSMTVSADGKMICTDPGAGILQPGWHGVGPLPDEPPPCEVLCCDGGGPFTALALAGANENWSQVAPAKRPPQKCKPPPCKRPRWQCELDCSKQKRICDKEAEDAYKACYDTLVRGRGCNTNFTSECNSKMRICEEIANKLRKPKCHRDYLKCQLKCTDCPEALAISLAKAGPNQDLIAAEITERFQAISDLVLPFVSSDSAIPSEIWTQAFELVAEADVVARGDAQQFLDQYILALEEETRVAEAEFGEDPGNAPPYPILFMAEIDRGTDVMTLRGDTGPFGQYSLFIPRDGNLIDVQFYDPHTKRIGSAFPRRDPTARYDMRRFNLYPVDDTFGDRDQDGLVDVVETIYGTDETAADSDGDGIFDGAEIEQGTNPLDGQPVRTGIVGTAKTPGSAVDVAAANDLLAVAEGTSGVSVFNIFNGMSPVLIAHVAVPGNAQRVASAGNFVAVVSVDAGVQIIDISTPATPAVVHQFGRTGAQAIAADGGVAYAGFGSGAVVALDLKTGLLRNELSVGSAVRDVALHGDYLYALTDDRLFAISLAQGKFAVAGLTNAPVSVTVNQRLFVGGGIAYTVHGQGYNTFDLADPAHPVLLATGRSAQFGWKHIAVNGSGMGVAVVGVNPTSPGDVSLYDLSSPRTNNLFLTQFVTPDSASAVSIFNGFAYVADGAAGIQVINYLSFDNKAVPPSIGLSTSAAGGVVESSQPLRVTANATDDVQVRNVEFYIDGQQTFSDGNFPFEYRFDTPVLTATKTNITLRARAIDTGGNFTWSEELTIKLGPDVTPPRIVTTAPLGGAKVVSSLFAYFNEPMNPATLNAASFRLISTGPDGLFDTADDAPVGGGVISYHAESPSVSLDFGAPLPDGLYRGVVTTAVADATGNRLASDYAWQFRVADAVFWSQGTDGFWGIASNWSTGTVPGPTDDIFIESIPGDITVFHGTPTRVIKKLVVGERVVITGGTWQITDTIELHQPLTLNGGTLKGGTVKENGAGKLIFAANAVNTLDGVRVEGDLTVSAAQVVVRNGLTLTGTAMLDNLGLLTFAGSQTFNTGQVSLAGDGQLVIEPGSTLTLGPAMVVRGRGAIGGGAFGTRRLINQGVISADGAGSTIGIRATYFENAGTFECKNGGSVSLPAGETMRNTGVISASSGGTLILNGTWNNAGTITAAEATVNLGGTFTLADLGTFNRTGGTVNLTGLLDLSGGILTLDATTGPWAMTGGTLKGGTVKQTGGAKLLFVAPNAMNTFDGMRLEGDLELTSTSTRAVIRNGLTLTGSVILDNTGAITFSGDQTFNTGQVVFAGTPGILGIEPGTTLTLGPAMVVRGKSGNIGQGVFNFFGTRKLINQGVIAADVAGGTFTIGPSQFENAGTLECKNGGSVTLSVNGDAIVAARNAGRIEASGGGTLALNGTWSNGGTITVNEATVNLGGAFTLADLGTLNRTGGTVNLTGVLDLGGGILTLDAATGPWAMTGGTLKGGTVKQTGGAKLVFVAFSAMNTFDGMKVEGDLVLTNTSVRALIRNGLSLTGSVVLDNAGAITFAGDQTFNTGQVVFAGTPGVLGIEPGTTLTLGPAMVVRGKTGFLGGNAFGAKKLINQGLIAADVPGGTLTITPTQFENPGTLRADGTGASIVIRVTPFTNTGTIQELNGGKVLINP